ncbi:MAG: translation initiation factor IF-1 [Candidatus Paceibacterota bacterium]
MPDKQKAKPVEGIIVEALPSANFKVKISDTEEILAYPSGKMRMYYIKVLPGDRVLVELSDDRKRGRITRRF